MKEEQIKQAFLDSLNQLDRTQVLDDCKLAVETLKNDETPEKEATKLNAEIEVVVELVKKNPHMSQEQIDLYTAKYEDLVERFKIEEHRVERKCAAIKRVEVFAMNLKNAGPVVTEFSSKLWSLLLDKAIVQHNNTIKFIYYSGVENTVII